MTTSYQLTYMHTQKPSMETPLCNSFSLSLHSALLCVEGKGDSLVLGITRFSKSSPYSLSTSMSPGWLPKQGDNKDHSQYPTNVSMFTTPLLIVSMLSCPTSNHPCMLRSHPVSHCPAFRSACIAFGIKPWLLSCPWQAPYRIKTELRKGCCVECRHQRVISSVYAAKWGVEEVNLQGAMTWIGFVVPGPEHHMGSAIPCSPPGR